MHFHFIGRREALLTLSCMLRHTLVPVCHKWLCLVGVPPGGRGEVTRGSCTDHGCKLNIPRDGAGLEEHACLAFSHHTCGGSVVHIHISGGWLCFCPLLPPCTRGEPSGKAANASLVYVAHGS